MNVCRPRFSHTDRRSTALFGASPLVGARATNRTGGSDALHRGGILFLADDTGYLQADVWCAARQYFSGTKVLPARVA